MNRVEAAMAKAAVAGLVRRLRMSVLQESFVGHERRCGILENNSAVQSFGRVLHVGHDSSCRAGIHDVPAAFRGGARREDLVGVIGTVVTRSYATRSTQLRRLAKQPVGRDGGGRRIRDRGVAGGEERHGKFHKRGGSASASNWVAAGPRKPWDTRRSPRQFDAVDRARSSVNSGQRPDRSGLMRARSFQDLQLQRRGFEDVETEGRFPCTGLGSRV